MRRLETKPQKLMMNFRASDWKDKEELFSNIDRELEPFGLELVRGECGDDNDWIKIEKRKANKKGSGSMRTR